LLGCNGCAVLHTFYRITWTQGRWLVQNDADPGVTLPCAALQVDGCLTECTPVWPVLTRVGDHDSKHSTSPAKVLALTVNDAESLTTDFHGYVHGLIATAMQAGWHRAANAPGLDTLSLSPAVEGVNPLVFRVPGELARQVISKSQTIAEDFATQLQHLVHEPSATRRSTMSGAVASGTRAIAAKHAQQDFKLAVGPVDEEYMFQS